MAKSQKLHDALRCADKEVNECFKQIRSLIRAFNDNAAVERLRAQSGEKDGLESRIRGLANISCNALRLLWAQNPAVYAQASDIMGKYCIAEVKPLSNAIEVDPSRVFSAVLKDLF